MKIETITYANAVTQAIDEEMTRDENIILMGEDVALHGGVFRTAEGLFEKYGPERIRNTPISENSFVGAAAGAALTGLRPIVEVMYIDFITLAMDQIINQAAKMRYMFGGKAKVPMVIMTQGGAGKGNAAHHSQSLESFFMHVPGLKVVMPSCASDAKGLLKSSIRDDNPVIFIQHKLLFPIEFPVRQGEDLIVPIGSANLCKTGRDITVLATSRMVHLCLEAAEVTATDGIDVEVIDPRTLVPLDTDTIINSIKKTGKLLVVHEANTRNGFGSEIVRMICETAFDYLDYQPLVLGGKNTPIPYSYILEDATIPNTETITNTIKRMI